MKSIKVLSSIISIFVGISIFATSSYAANSSDTTSPQVGNAQTQKNGEIIAILMAVDKNEIAAAKEALKKDTTPAIKQYAQMLKTQHTQNLNAVLKLSKKIDVAPIETATVTSLQKEGAKKLVSLSALKGKAFEKAYIDTMVTGHTAVLKMLDDDLLKNVSNPSLKKLLLATRPKIESHLQKGQTIQKSLN